MTLRENTLTVCCFVFKSTYVILNKHYLLQHQYFAPAIHALFRDRCGFFQSVVHVLNVPPPPPSNQIDIV